MFIIKETARSSTFISILYKPTPEKEGHPLARVSDRTVENTVLLLSEVPVQQALEGFSMPGFVAGHLIRA